MTQADIARAYLAALTNDLTSKSAADPALAGFVKELKTIDTSVIQRGPLPRLEHPTMAMLDKALEAAEGDATLLPSAAEAARVLDWGQIYDDGSMDPALTEGMLAAQAAGTYGCFSGKTVATGFFLLAPGVHYALHTHAATEIYYCLSGIIDIQHGIDAAPFAVTPGNYSITPADRVHSLSVRSEPVLMIYAWIGELSCPIWLWSQDNDGGWIRERWMRKPGEPWKVEEREVISDEAMAVAHG
ncbi:MAG: cupin domain-containing protein [Rhizobiales bacterium]|nr:cupin domain-containing protein [Hyphomicrobiales bacterium]